ncbi:hypothetical protein TELCIR_05737 [Teladorsagia circumcincta]|uniref:SCP domain-containing protein n=1 Tax=Teladorsagia circumcincta TaxID=45464 RepID=A0A2G9UQ31_TELCI|nr:hypothetical protein TELCIR_05737 [Teladorsagia circumcincta]
MYSPTNSSIRQKEQIGHYTQMVWQDGYKLGCVIEYCDIPPAPMTFVVCQYGPGGNFIDQFIYGKRRTALNR